MDFKELDDLLNFDYSGEEPVPAKSEAELYAALRSERRSQETTLRSESHIQEAALRSENQSRETARAENEKRIAQEEAYQRYRKSTKKKVGKARNATKFSKILAAVYLVFLAAFGVIMTIMNVLPFKLLIVLYIILGLLSFIMVVQLTRDRVKKWARGLATFMAILLIFVYGVGSAYALGTLSFLEGTSVKNENKVGKISEDSFNVLITGMDVWGKITEPGRSDVNMVVTVNPKTATILLTSIPRDYEIHMPDHGNATDKLTHTGFYSQQTTILAIEDLLDIKTNYYVKVNFDTIVRFVDAIGGLDIYNEKEFTSALTKHVYKQGNIHVQGRGALYYARERKAFKEGDNQRVKNQQLIFSAMLEKAMSSKTMIVSYSSVLTSLEDYFEMSFSSAEIRSLAKLQLAKSPDWKIYKNTLYGSGALKATYTGGSQELYVTEQNPTSIAYSKGLINAVMSGKTLKEGKDGKISIVDGE